MPSSKAGRLTYVDTRQRYEGLSGDRRYRIKVPKSVLEEHRDKQRFMDRKHGLRLGRKSALDFDFLSADFWLGQKRLDYQVRKGSPPEFREDKPDLDSIIVQSHPPMTSPEKDMWEEDEDDRRFDIHES